MHVLQIFCTYIYILILFTTDKGRRKEILLFHRIIIIKKNHNHTLFLSQSPFHWKVKYFIGFVYLFFNLTYARVFSLVYYVTNVMKWVVSQNSSLPFSCNCCVVGYESCDVNSLGDSAISQPVICTHEITGWFETKELLETRWLTAAVATFTIRQLLDFCSNSLGWNFWTVRAIPQGSFCWV